MNKSATGMRRRRKSQLSLGICTLLLRPSQNNGEFFRFQSDSFANLILIFFFFLLFNLHFYDSIEPQKQAMNRKLDFLLIKQ